MLKTTVFCDGCNREISGQVLTVTFRAEVAAGARAEHVSIERHASEDCWHAVRNEAIEEFGRKVRDAARALNGGSLL